MKLADRLHNLISAHVTAKAFRERYIAETEKYYVPLSRGTIFEKDISNALENLEDNKIQYKGYPVYNSNTLSESTGLAVMACSGILRILKNCCTIEEKQKKLHKLVNSRQQVIQIVKQLDPNVESVTDFTKKYNIPKEILRALEEMDVTFNQRKQKMKEYVRAV